MMFIIEAVLFAVRFLQTAHAPICDYYMSNLYTYIIGFFASSFIVMLIIVPLAKLAVDKEFILENMQGVNEAVHELLTANDGWLIGLDVSILLCAKLCVCVVSDIGGNT